LFFEQFDEFIDKTGFVGSDVFVFKISFTFPDAGGDGVVVVGRRLEIDFPSFVFVGSGGLDGNVNFVEVDVESVFIIIKVFDFIIRVVQPGGQLPGSLNFVGFGVSEGGFEVLFEGVQKGVDLGFKITFRFSGNGGGFGG